MVALPPWGETVAVESGEEMPALRPALRNPSQAPWDGRKCPRWVRIPNSESPEPGIGGGRRAAPPYRERFLPKRGHFPPFSDSGCERGRFLPQRDGILPKRGRFLPRRGRILP